MREDGEGQRAAAEKTEALAEVKSEEDETAAKLFKRAIAIGGDEGGDEGGG